MTFGELMDKLNASDIESEFKLSIMSSMEKIACELKRANELKALELKGRMDLSLSPEMVDNVMEDE